MHQKNNTFKIGIFDSGLGGLTVQKEISKLMPCYEYIYLGDNKNAPYGDKSQAEIFNLTLAGVEWLFKNEAEIVILACNTASSNALRRIQQEILPKKYPNKKVLGIIIPTVEELSKFCKTGKVGMLATKATVESRAYEIETEKLSPHIQIVSQTGGDLAHLIELNNTDELLKEIKRVTSKLMAKDNLIDVVLLACTHYPLIAKEIKQILPKHLSVVGQGELVAAKLYDYLNKHSEIRDKLSREYSLKFYTTSNSNHVKQMMEYFYGESISISVAVY